MNCNSLSFKNPSCTDDNMNTTDISLGKMKERKKKRAVAQGKKSKQHKAAQM